MDRTRQILLEQLPRLRKFAYSLIANRADADDLIHDVVVRTLQSGIPEGREPVAWLLRVCKNRWIDILRARQISSRGLEQQREIADMQQELQYNNLNESEQSVNIEEIIEGMQHLPEDQRLALSLVSLQGRSYIDASRILDVPIGTLMSRVARARAFLMAYYGDKDGSL